MWKVDGSLYLEDSEACGCLQYLREWISSRADGILGTEMERYGRHDSGLLEMDVGKSEQMTESSSVQE